MTSVIGAGTFRNPKVQVMVMGEVLIRLPKITDELSSKYDFLTSLKNKKTLHIHCPLVGSVEELKLRIQGLTSIPKSLIALFCCGELLKDSDIVPTEYFSLQKSAADIIADPDGEVFRSRSKLYRMFYFL